MDYLEAIGQVLREVRVGANLSREVLNRDHLARVEQGKQSLTLGKLNALCELLGVSPSTVLFTAEARLAHLKLGAYKADWDARLGSLQAAGRLHSEVQVAASTGVRGKRAEETRAAVLRLQAEGCAKMEVVRQLGIGRTTVDRYWAK
jgi:transcriptional regulator with XRE-family HTH domain